MRLIYLDHAASSLLDSRVLAKMQHSLETHQGNPSSLHHYGQTQSEAIEEARLQAANLLNVSAQEILWTSGATESINLAIKGAARLYQKKGKHIITLLTEHKAVLDSCQFLEKEGFNVTYLKPKKDGLLDLAELSASIRADTILISIMHVNNETGVMQDIERIAKLTADKGILLHVDAVQSLGKFPLDLGKIPIDLLSASAHKMYGPKGIGLLYLRKKPRVRVEPLLHGGGHEQGMRSGTLASHQIIGMGECMRIAKEEMQTNIKHITTLHNALLAGLQQVPNMHSNSSNASCSPYILSARFAPFQAIEILRACPTIVASTASACQSFGAGSHVLRAMGLDEQEAKCSIRFSLGKQSTRSDIDEAVNILQAYFRAI